MKHALIFLSIALAYTNIHAQETSNWSALFAAQKHYVSTVITPAYRAAYLTQINMAHIAHTKVWAEIKKLYPSVSLGESWNMVEKFSPAGDLSGVFWTGEQATAFYQFQYGSDRRLLVSQQALTQLPDTIATIISHFQNWEHAIFATQGQALGAPRASPFFLGSRFFGDVRDIICFYYP